MKKYILKLGIPAILLVSLFGCSQGVGGTDGQEATAEYDQEPEVKKSTSGICHERGSTYYDRTSNFVPYDSIEDCLDSGGRLPQQ